MTVENDDKLLSDTDAPKVVRRRKKEADKEVVEITAESSDTLLAAVPVKPVVTMAAAPRDRAAERGEVDFAAMMNDIDLAGDVEQGTIVNGAIVAITSEWAFIDLGAKTEGILALSEIQDAEGNLTLGVNDTIEAFVVSTARGEIKLSKKLGQQIRDQESLFEAYESGFPVEGRVVSTNKGGFEIRLAGRRGFCPISQIELGFTEDAEVHIGQTYHFKITELSPDGKRLVLSRAALKRAERDERRKALQDQLVEGAELDGEVTSVQEYGAFVDIGGIEGLVHVSELSWKRVEHPSEVVAQGDHVRVKVLNIKEGEKGLRIGLSIRELESHPWEVQVGTKFVVGETYDGTVTRVEAYGAFVELGPAVEGLIHVSELSWERRINHASEILNVGQPVRVYVKSIEPERRRMGLSLKALQDDPWANVRRDYPEGSAVECEVEKVQPFGIFVIVAPGITGLIPASESNTGQGTDLRREFEPGRKLKATVLSVEPSRKRMSLSLKAAAEFEDQKEVRDFFEKQKSETKGGFGTLGDLFKKKLGG